MCQVACLFYFALCCFSHFLCVCVQFSGEYTRKMQALSVVAVLMVHVPCHVDDFSRIVFTPKCTYFDVKAVSDFEIVEKLNHPADSQFEDGKNGRKSFKVQVIL